MKRKKHEKRPPDEDGFAEWGGYMAAKAAKLIDQFKETTSNNEHKLSNIFKGVFLFVNGLTDPSSYEIKDLMSMHGGSYHQYQIPGATTHIIASNLPNVKIKNLGSIPIVKPLWITESIIAGRLLDYKKYLLYTNENRTQPRLHFENINKLENVQEENAVSAVVENKERSVSPDLFNDFSPNQLGLPVQQKNKLTEEPVATNCLKLEGNVTAKNISINSKKITKTAVDPGFLSEFYTNSRLHHIATIGATFKQLVSQWREQNKSNDFPGRNKLQKLNAVSNAVKTEETVVMHIDMDCFFVSVGLRSRPELRGLPVAVTHAKGGHRPGQNRPGVDREAEIHLVHERYKDKISKLEGVDTNCSMSEIACCSYEARKSGIRNGMFLGGALKLCPNLQTIPYDFEGYKEVANILYETIAEYTLDIEAVSCDEMFVDVGPLLRETNVNVEQWAQHIRKEIVTKTGCTCSTGFGGNRLQARLATRKAKPDGYFHLKPEDVEEYMKEVNLKDLPGVGYSTLSKLKTLKLSTCGDVKSFPLTRLQSELGNRNGETIYRQCFGEDRKPLCFQHERKSVSAEVNYGIRFTTMEEAKTFLSNLSEELESRLMEIGMQARSVTLKVMVRAKEAPVETAKFLGHGVCDSLSRSNPVSTPITKASAIFKEALSLFHKLKIDPTELRGIGLQLTRLEKIKSNVNALRKFFTKTTVGLEEDKSKDISKNLDNTNSTTESLTPENEKEKLVQESKICVNVDKEIHSNRKNANKKCDIIKVSVSTDTDDIPFVVTPKINTKSNTSVNNSTGKRGRGRPRKGAASMKVEVKRNGNDTLKTFFKSVGNSSSRDLQNKLPYAQQDIDMCVLKQLPDHIQNEILQDYKLNQNDFKQKIISNKSAAIAVNNQSKIISTKEDKKIEKTIGEKIKPSEGKLEQHSKSIFSDLSYEELKDMLKGWIQKQKNPKQFDIDMIGKHFKQMALSRKIEELFCLTSILNRYVNETNMCEWHDAYIKIINYFQEGMIAQYGSPLYLKHKISCPLHDF